MIIYNSQLISIAPMTQHQSPLQSVSVSHLLQLWCNGLFVTQMNYVNRFPVGSPGYHYSPVKLVFIPIICIPHNCYCWEPLPSPTHFLPIWQNVGFCTAFVILGVVSALIIDAELSEIQTHSIWQSWADLVRWLMEVMDLMDGFSSNMIIVGKLSLFLFQCFWHNFPFSAHYSQISNYHHQG